MEAGYTQIECDTRLEVNSVVVMYNWEGTNKLGYSAYSPEAFKRLEASQASNYIVATFKQKTK